MRPKTGLVLLVWSALSCMATLFAAMLWTSPEWIDKSMIPPASAVFESGALDAGKLEAQCKVAGFDPPGRLADGSIPPYELVRWMNGGTKSMSHQVMTPLVFALGLGTVISGACGVSCMRGGTRT